MQQKKYLWKKMYVISCWSLKSLKKNNKTYKIQEYTWIHASKVCTVQNTNGENNGDENFFHF